MIVLKPRQHAGDRFPTVEAIRNSALSSKESGFLEVSGQLTHVATDEKIDEFGLRRIEIGSFRRGGIQRRGVLLDFGG